MSDGNLDKIPKPESTLVAVRSVSKHFGAVQALNDVSLDIEAGTVHALVGANGAGKSTLINVLAGIVHPDSGTIEVDGVEVEIPRPTKATSLGFEFVHQELNLVPGFTVLENMTLGHVPSNRFGLIRWRNARKRAQEVLDLLEAPFSVDAPLRDLSVNEQWTVSMGRALMRNARLIAMDEPTASLTDAEVENLFGIIRSLRSKGVTILYVSHRLKEILDITSRVTVFRDGRNVGTFSTDELDRASLTEKIVGRAVAGLVNETRSTDPQDGEKLLEVEGLEDGSAVRGASFAVSRREILGIAGLVGSGRTEIAHVIAGLKQPIAGHMSWDGEEYRPKSPLDALKKGIAYVPEERRSQGLVLTESVEFNINMASISRGVLRKWLPIISVSQSRQGAREVMDSFGIKAPSVLTAVSNLSGGNQQKVVIGKYLRTDPRLLILDEPTVGVDVGARSDIYRDIRGLVESGTAVVIISSDFDELVMCDRVVVIKEGRVTESVTGSEITKDNLTHLCYESKEHE